MSQPDESFRKVTKTSAEEKASSSETSETQGRRYEKRTIEKETFERRTREVEVFESGDSPGEGTSVGSTPEPDPGLNGSDVRSSPPEVGSPREPVVEAVEVDGVGEAVVAGAPVVSIEPVSSIAIEVEASPAPVSSPPSAPDVAPSLSLATSPPEQQVEQVPVGVRPTECLPDWSRDVPQRLKIVLRGCVDAEPPCMTGNPTDLDGDFILDLVLQDDRTCIWEVTFPAICGFYRASLRCQPAPGGYRWFAGLEGLTTGPQWQGITSEGIPDQLVLVVSDPSTVKSGCNITWPACVDLVELVSAFKRATAAQQQAQAIRQLMEADFGPGSVEPPVGATPVTPQQTPSGEQGIDLQNSMPLMVLEVSLLRDVGNGPVQPNGAVNGSPDLSPKGTGGAGAIAQAGQLTGFPVGGGTPTYLSGIGLIGSNVVYPDLVSQCPILPTHPGCGAAIPNDVNVALGDNSNCGANPDPNFVFDPAIKAAWTPAPDQFCAGKIWVFGRYKNDLVYVQAFAERMGWVVVRNPDGCSWWFKSKSTGELVPVPCCCCG